MATQVQNHSGILVRVPSKLIRIFPVLIIAAAQAFSTQTQPTQALAVPRQTASQPLPPVPQQTSPTPGEPALVPTLPTGPPKKTLAVVILDPAHGGPDRGARGSSGVAESDVVLSYARLLRISLEAQGLRAILTRQTNDDPSFDDRSKLANAQRAGIFISLHVSSTGQPGTVRVYSLPHQDPSKDASVSPRSGLLSWDRAQFNFIDQSRRLAELIQIQMAQRFRGSSETPFEAPVRQLRTVGTPAVAIEVSSVSVPDRSPLDQMGPGLADGIARAVAAFRTIYESGGGK
jgi:N-acetylmuramoyl-L-alanine amidase